MELERQPELVLSREMRATYTQNYQPTYPDEQKLQEAVAELENTEPVTTPEEIRGLKSQLVEIADGTDRRPIVMLGPCAEPVNLTDPIDSLASDYWSTVEIADSAFQDPLVISRSRGQSAKPRSSEYEASPDGDQVPSYYGDMINSISAKERTPDPSRMVAAAIQARDIETALTRAAGSHIPAAHEALLLPYEQSFIRRDQQTGEQYLLSADLPWIGERTNDPDSDQVEMLSRIDNPVGIKLGPSATEEQISGLVEKLNPGSHPGKLVFMPRLGLEDMGSLPGILTAIKKHAPGSVIVCDAMHGNTKQTTREDGSKVKTRVVSDIVKEVKVVAKACEKQGLRLHGLHLEARGKDDREECVDEHGQIPHDKSVVDPELNNRQLRRVLQETNNIF